MNKNNECIDTFISGRAYDPKSWMEKNRDAFQSMTLGKICMPGAHDAGMSSHGTGTFGAFKCNIVTQENTILGQLNLGVRYFDIRPVISSGEYYTGHYSEVPVLGWQGANGQSLDSIISDVNTFTETQNELIIIYLSHDLDTDCGRSYQSFTQEQYAGLCEKLESINFRATSTGSTFLNRTLGEFIGGSIKPEYPSQSSVVIIAEPSRNGVTPTAGSLVHTQSKLEVYNEYTDTNDLTKMMNDQITKMKAGHRYFLLSWTLTQDATQAATCEFGTASSILDLAKIANNALKSHLMPAITSTVYPNIIYLDGIDNAEAVTLSVNINYTALGQ